ncbi:MAG: putative Phosphoesterase [Modestobacter sp.]|nr:putative Phosphoesterase [Modestobacter sp.]
MLCDSVRRCAAVRRRTALAALLLAVLVALLVGVLAGGRIVDLDLAVYRWSPAQHWPQLSGVLAWWVVLGQRAVCLSLAALWLGWRARRERDRRPLVLLLVATALTEVGVGGMKMLVGRLGPLQLGADAVLPGAAQVFAAGGTIFPSGHTANAVVTWGVVAMLARERRRLGAVLAAAVAVSVGLTTVYLGTHWLTDVLAGWCAGGLVLLAVPVAVPWAVRAGGAVRRRAVALVPDPLAWTAARPPTLVRPGATPGRGTNVETAAARPRERTAPTHVRDPRRPAP